MSVRQYIGARYVPRFSTVNGGVWSNAYTYEALEIVKYGNDYYTSKKPVPTGIDIANTEYWVLTGNYNGAISGLSDRIDVVENDIAYINDREKKGYILITDSYGEVNNNQFPIVFGNKTAPETYYYNASSGSGFTNGTTFLQQLKNVENISGFDTDKITDIIVVGGVNDGVSTYSDIYTAVVNFINYVELHYDYAKVHIGFISKSTTTGAIYGMLNTVLKAYQFGSFAGKRGCYIKNAECILGNEMIGSDHIHPTIAGSNYLGWCLANYILNGNAIGPVYHNTFEITTITDFPAVGTPVVTIDRASDTDLFIHSDTILRGVDSNKPCNYFTSGAKFAECAGNTYINSPSYDVGSIPVTVSFKILNGIQETQHIWLDCAGKLMFRPDGVYLKAIPSYDLLSKNFSQFAIWQGINYKVNPFYI